MTPADHLHRQAALVEAAVFDAFAEVNAELPADMRVTPRRNTVLSGEGRVLDSLALVMLMVAVEQRVGERLKVAIRLGDDRSLSEAVSPFSTLGTLADYVARLVAEQQGLA